MKIAGFKKQSLIDFSGNISSVIFTQGCNFRCGYCHNKNLVLPECFGEIYDENNILNYLEKYKKLLDAVCITGGEPTIHKDLPVFIAKIKNLGLKVKLDSNGTNPQMIETLINKNLIDFIAMDIKHILYFDKYNLTVGGMINKDVFNKIIKSINIIKDSEIDYQFRTTIAEGLHSKEEIFSLKNTFNKNYKIQNFKPDIVLDSNLAIKPFSKKDYNELLTY